MASRRIHAPRCPSKAPDISAADHTFAQVSAVARTHWPVVVVAVLATCLLFTHLGQDYLWEDEGDTAVLARSINQHGIPVAWDGVTFTAPDYGQRLKFGFVMVSHPWLQYYAAAASFALFGDTPWAARLPFALAGLLTILIAYAMTWHLLRNRFAALSVTILLTANVQFLLFARQARNYPFNALLTCLLIWQFLRLESRKDAVPFAGLGILLFHAHPIGLAAVTALGLLTLVHQPFIPRRRWFWPAAAALAVYVAPWLILSRAGYEWNVTPLNDASLFGPRLLQFAIECLSVTPLLGLAALALVLFFRRPPHAQASCARNRPAATPGVLTRAEQSLAVACASVIAAEAIVVALTHSRDMIWVEGLHHTPAIIPLAIMPTALLIAKVSRSNRRAWFALMLIFTCTRLGQAAPWAFWADPVVVREPDSLATFHVPSTLTDRIFRTTQIHYIKSLLRPNPGVIARITEFLRQNAARGDVVVTNYAWEALYFHTDLPQGAKIERSFPIYQAARDRQLPDYVFGETGARWIVWRRAWPAYFQLQDCERILRQLTRAGAVTHLVRSVPETLFENRENVHFHRFADDTYLFPWHHDLPDVLIYRVDWPARLAGS